MITKILEVLEWSARRNETPDGEPYVKVKFVTEVGDFINWYFPRSTQEYSAERYNHLMEMTDDLRLMPEAIRVPSPGKVIRSKEVLEIFPNKHVHTS